MMKNNLILCIFLFLISCNGIEPVDSIVKEIELLPDIRVEGIMYDEENSIAIVNGDAKEVDDTIGGVKIVNIGEDYVQFQYKDKTFIKKVTAKEKIKSSPKVFPKKSPNVIKPNRLNREHSIHLTNAKKYYRQAKKTHRFGYYEKAIKEAQWALMDDKVTGKEKEKAEQIINDCRKFVSSNKKPKKKESGWKFSGEMGEPRIRRMEGVTHPGGRLPDGVTFPQQDKNKKHPEEASSPYPYDY